MNTRNLVRFLAMCVVGAASVALAEGDARAQAESGTSGGVPAGVQFEVVRLYGVEGRTLVEIYSRIPTNVLAFTESDGRWEAALAFELEVRRGDEVVLEDSWTRTKTAADRRMLDSPRLFFVETHAFLVPPGSYDLEATVRDADGKELGRLTRTLEAPQEHPPVSDLLLVSRIVPDTAAPGEGYDPVRKNRLVLNPNPGQIYSSTISPLVFFYYEFENVGSDPLNLERVLRFRTKEGDEVVKEVRALQTYRPGWSVDHGAVNISGLKPGDYWLELAWEAPAGGTIPDVYRGVTRRQEFHFVREAVPALAGGMPAGGEASATVPPPPGPAAVDYYEGYSEAHLDSVFNTIEVFFPAADKSLFRSLSSEGKRNLLNQFWARSDPTPGTPENEWRDEVAARFAYVNEHFRGPGQEGWETPRGRIWLKFGKPDRRLERVLESGFSAPYEIWIYYATGYKYAFLDEFRNRRYILLTSTDPEEQGRPDWQERVPVDVVREILRE